MRNEKELKLLRFIWFFFAVFARSKRFVPVRSGSFRFVLTFHGGSSPGKMFRAVRRHWFRWAMAAVAIGYAARSLARNEPYWEPDVDYLHWSTDVPAVTVCPSSSPSVTVADER